MRLGVGGPEGGEGTRKRESFFIFSFFFLFFFSFSGYFYIRTHRFISVTLRFCFFFRGALRLLEQKRFCCGRVDFI